MNITELEDLLKRASEAYYNLDPIMSDNEYDALYETLKALKPNSAEVRAVGATVSGNDWGKETHVEPMGSLFKVNDVDEFLSWSNDKDEYLITHKLDGLSLECVYENGSLMKTVTRGDGYVGENVTPNGQRINGIPKNVSGNLRIRGEVILPVRVFNEKYKDIYANPRNAAAGMLRDRKNGHKSCEDLKFIAFWVSTQKTSHSAVFLYLQELGFNIPQTIKIGKRLDIVSHFETSKEERTKLDYEIDGMVVYINDMEKFVGLGSKDRRPLGAIAWKYAAQSKVSKLVDIRWSVGPTGRVNPIAIIEPVNIGGVTITNVSLQNNENFKSLNLYKGATLIISRKNDVIPYVEGVVSDVDL